MHHDALLSILAVKQHDVKVTLRSQAFAVTILFLFLILPSLLRFLLPVSSMSAGVAVGATSVIFLKLRTLKFSWEYFLSNSILLLLIGIAASTHFAFAAMLSPVNGSRFVFSLLLALLLIVAAIVVSPVVFGSMHVNGRPERAIFFILILSALFGIVGIQPSGVDVYTKPVFPFTEPSHFALVFTPILLWMSVTARGVFPYVYIIFGLIIAVLLQNVTMVVGVILTAAVCLPVFRFLLVSFVMAGAAVALNSDLSYFSDRISFASESSNLSALVYLQGWQLIEESLSNSMGWGLGFQQLGENETSVQAALMINAILKTDSNISDGGFMLVKVVSEFGIFGIVAVAIYFHLFVASFRRLRHVALNNIDCPAGKVLALAITVTYVIELLIRGIGYFSGTGFLLISAIVYLYSGTSHLQGWKITPEQQENVAEIKEA